VVSNFIYLFFHSIYRLKELQDKEKNMKYEISSYDLIERENKMLQQRLKALSATYYSDLVIQEEEREARKQQNFDTRMMMDLVLRKTIKALDKDYKEKAVSICISFYILFQAL